MPFGRYTLVLPSHWSLWSVRTTAHYLIHEQTQGQGIQGCTRGDLTKALMPDHSLLCRSCYQNIIFLDHLSQIMPGRKLKALLNRTGSRAGGGTHGSLYQVNAGLQVEAEVDEVPLDALPLVLLLLQDEHGVVEQLL